MERKNLPEKKPFRTLQYLMEIALISAFLILVANASVLSDLIHGGITIVWWPAPIPFLVFYLRGLNRWPGILIGYALHYYIFSPGMVTEYPEYSWILAVFNTGEAAILVVLLRKFRVTTPFKTWRDTYLFVLTGVLPIGFLSACVGTFLIWISGFELAESAGFGWFWWYAEDAIPALLIVPFALIFSRLREFVGNRQETRLWARIVLVSIVLGVLSFYPVFPQQKPLQVGLSLMYVPLVLFAMIRLGAKGAATVNFIGGGLSLYAVSLGMAFWPLPGDTAMLYVYWMTLLLVISGSLLLGAWLDHVRTREAALSRDAKALVEP